MESKLLKRKQYLLKKRDNQAVAEVCVDLGDNYFTKYMFLEAIEEYKMAMERCSINKDTMLFAKTCRMIGEAYTEIGNFEEATKYNRDYLTAAIAANNRLEEVRAFISIGRTYLIQVMSKPKYVNEVALNNAEENFCKAITLAKKLHDISKSEYQELHARIVLNLGLVKEYWRELDEGIDYMLKSIKISKANSLWNLLHRSYLSIGNMYLKKKDFQSAMEHYDGAVDAAERLRDNSKLSTALVNKAEVLVELQDFKGARQVFLRAYKLLPENEKSTVERQLKIVAALCIEADKLIDADVSDYAKRKELYERLGDGCASLKCYRRAIAYYLKTLECEEKISKSPKDLQSIYFSLAKTYADVEMFDDAVKYFEKEYAVTQHDRKESYYTLKNWGEVLARSGAPYERVVEKFEKALADARELPGDQEQAEVLTAYIKALLHQYGKEKQANKLKALLDELTYDEIFSDSDENDDPTIGDDIEISQIIDTSDSEDTSPNASRHLRKRARRFTVRKNAKGESQLHQACINNNFELARRLIQQGHPIDIPDNCGWTPLHEACNYGNIELVQLLLENGANPNQRSNSASEGYTALMDAASNGHLEVMELLLKHGANPLAHNNHGYTPLDCLKDYRNRTPDDAIDISRFESLVRRLTTVMEKSGDIVNNKSLLGEAHPEPSALILEEEAAAVVLPRATGKRSRSPAESPQRPRGSRCTSPVYGSDSSDCEPDREGSNAQREYKQVMENLRKRAPVKTTKPSPVHKPDPPGLISETEAVDDWLENDLQPRKPAKKRRTSSLSHYTLNTPSSRSSSVSGSFQNESEEDEVVLVEKIAYMPSSSQASVKQVSLLNSGFSRTVNENSIGVQCVEHITPRTEKWQQKMDRFVANHSSSASSTEDYFAPTPQPFTNLLSINVKIEDKTWRIPVQEDQLSNLTIGWLANEAARRYYKKEGISPTLQLEINGAILENDDPLRMIFITPTQAEEVQSSIVSWDLPPLPDRYIECCKNNNKELYEPLRERLAETQGTLSLKLNDFPMDNAQFIPLFRALKRQHNLQLIDLSGIGFTDANLQELCLILPTIVQLRSLNLSMNCITGEGLHALAAIFTGRNPVLEHLVELNLSYNWLREACLKHIGRILAHTQLKTLSLVACSLSNQCYDCITRHGIELDLRNLEALDLSYNELNTQSALLFLSLVNFQVLSKLNISQNTNINESGICEEIANAICSYEQINLKSLGLARCKVNDAELFKLLKNLPRSTNFEQLDLSYNPDLSGVSLRRVLQNRPTFAHVRLDGCVNITDYFNNSFCISSNEHDGDTSRVKELQISIDLELQLEYADRLCDIWKREWSYRAKIEKLYSSFLRLSIVD